MLLFFVFTSRYLWASSRIFKFILFFIFSHNYYIPFLPPFPYFISSPTPTINTSDFIRIIIPNMNTQYPNLKSIDTINLNSSIVSLASCA